eukprot:5829941-Amphidinium_carterae.1
MRLRDGGMRTNIRVVQRFWGTKVENRDLLSSISAWFEYNIEACPSKPSYDGSANKFPPSNTQRSYLEPPPKQAEIHTY